MRTFYVLLLFALTAIADSSDGPMRRSRSKRELLVRHKRRWVLSTIELREEEPGPYPKAISQMYNNKTGTNHEFQIRGMGVDEDPKGVFSINPENGVVYAHRPIDREIYEKPFHIKFDILDKLTKMRLDRELAFDVEITDINDNAPRFSKPQMVVNVNENTPPGYLPLQLYATDRDKTNTTNSKIDMTIISQEPQEPKVGLKKINSRMTQLELSEGCFDYDKIKKYEIIVQVKDHGTPSLSSTAVVIINVIDTNTHQPKFKGTTFQGEVKEAELKDNIVRFSVEDKDTPNTPGWRAVYFFIQGNEDNNYKIVTDPKTNDGILSVIKAKDYERTTLTSLQIGVRNEQDIFICNAKSPIDASTHSLEDSANITIKVIDVNDPPEFLKSPADVYVKEEESPGKLLFTPQIRDVDSDMSGIRYVVLEDPENWVTIDKKTGAVTSVKKMDRESPFVNDTGIYKIVIGAIDNGDPVATGTGTIMLHLGDINDNVPHLVNKGVIMCGNKVNKVTVSAADTDAVPFNGPFTFSVDDKTLQSQWKLVPHYGHEAGLLSQKTLAYGNYSVPLLILDQQNMAGRDTLEVMVCDCGTKDVCRGKHPISTSLGPAGIGLMFAGLLLFLLLLLIFMCQCGNKEFKHIPMVQEEGNQTLIQYNQEGGVSECKAEPILHQINNGITTDGIRKSTKQITRTVPIMTQENLYSSNSADMGMYNSYNVINSNMNSMSLQRQAGQSTSSAWTRDRSYKRDASQYNRSISLKGNQWIEGHLDRKLHTIQRTDHLEYQPHQYDYEGQDSRCQSLDGLSLSNMGEDLTFLNDLGPKFKKLGGICQIKTQGQNTQL